jgi:lysine decarboxylase
VIEKAGVQTITLIATFQLRPEAVPRPVAALVDILAGSVLAEGARQPMPANPFAAVDDRPSCTRTGRAATRSRSGTSCRCARRSGKVAAEEVEV